MLNQTTNFCIPCRKTLSGRFLCLCMLLALSLQQSQASVRRDIQKQYDLFAKAYVKHDVDTMLGILAPGYTLRNNMAK